MTELVQPTLIDIPPVEKPRELTERQQLAYEYVRITPGGVTADEVGAWLHAHKPPEQRPHGVDQRCIYCTRDGRSVLTSVAVSPLVIRRRGGKYEPRNKADRAREIEQRREPTEAELAANPFAGLDA